jgi:hypothetical protein
MLHYPDVVREAIIAAAFLSTQSPYILPPGEEIEARQAHHKFRDPGGDFVSYLKLLYSYEASPNKQRFSDKNYLDERAMAEISNVTMQLEEIVSSLKFPIHRRNDLPSGVDLDDYLCCAARGLIQFVCVKENSRSMRSSHVMYRSLTAGRIIIHPGSVMFKMDPKYIVAGEIVQTARTYAMSVSPLSEKILKRLDSNLFLTFKSTDDPYIEDDYKKHKIASTKTDKPWNKRPQPPDKMKSSKNLDDLLEQLPYLARKLPGKSRRATDERKKGAGKAPGFLTLFTDGNCNYWIKATKSLHGSINESLASVESLIDELDDDIDIDKKHIVNQTYRRLSDLLLRH